MARQYKAFLSAVGFLTIVPAGKRAAAAFNLAQAAAYFPATGLLIGLAAALLALALETVLPDQAADALLVAFLAVISGGLHLDALADTADGLFGGGDRQRRLEIMSDSAAGPFGVTAVVLCLLLKYAFLNSLTGPARPLALLTVPALARWPMLAVSWRVPPAKQDGLGNSIAGGLKPAAMAIGSLSAVLIAGIPVIWLGPLAVAAMALLIGLAGFYGRVNRSLLGGVTGDTLGALVELSEVLLLLFWVVVTSVA